MTQLRPYQTESVEAVRGFWAAGKRCPLLVAPTGAGKTEMSKAILEPFRFPMAVVHTETLFEQTARRVPNARIYTVQSLIAPGAAGDRRRAGLKRHDCAWMDEAHHMAAGAWSKVLSLLGDMPRFGVTATPKRADGTPLGDIFDAMHVAAKYSDLLRDGYLVRCDVQSPQIGRKDQKKEKVRPDGVAAYLEHGRVPLDDPRSVAGLKWRPGIHFEVTIEACESACQRYNEAGVRSAVVCKDTSTEERAHIFAEYTAGRLDMLCSPTALAEGFDSPRAEVCVLRRSCDHVGDFMQRVGRVLRPFSGKARALLIDCCDTKQRHGLPTDDRVFSLDGQGIANVPPPAPEGVIEDEEPAGPAPQPWRTEIARYTIIQDTLLSRYRDLQAQALDNGYKPGWVWHRFTEATSIAAPSTFAAKYQSVCVHCRKRLKVGEMMFWPGTKQAYHEECWFRSLDGERLEAASEALEHAEEWRPIRSRRVHDSSDVHGDNDIPF